VTLTDHPGLDLVVLIRERDRAGGSGSGLVMEMPRFHDRLRRTRGNAVRTIAVPQIGREPASLIVRFPAGATPCFGSIFFEEARMAKKRKRKYSRGAGTEVKREMHRYKRGKAKSGKGGRGGKVKSRKQAIAIALSKARKKGKKVPRKKK
jgi:Family of unknown function (DUF6496)